MRILFRSYYRHGSKLIFDCNCWLFGRFWCFQLFPYFFRGNNAKCSVYGNMWHWLCIACVAMWFKFNSRSERYTGRSNVFRYNLFFASMGLYGWHKRAPLRDQTDFINCIHFICAFYLYQQFLCYGCHAIYKRIFVGSFEFFLCSQLSSCGCFLTLIFMSFRRVCMSFSNNFLIPLF